MGLFLLLPATANRRFAGNFFKFSICYQIGFDLMAAVPAPHDEANLGAGGIAARHRRPPL
jgi:hypothetical protein